ncbi:hypothetical protein [Methylocystis parvus]|uniref:Uncharacterized protein n=1 Tax=Methylocystis parvus TaxID=134 RepID=A0A6B8M633_9HYPH|nr:hypothetical protein [Methylocystis parvus]QGM97805.1 hypothetical protein F7D14_10215 [Methylocystis parvus]WBK01887.1 hypothetical protein MMG94_09365 [Methylocystis parvus OBBP]
MRIGPSSKCRAAHAPASEALIETLLELLDTIDGDGDLEVDPDFEADPAEAGLADDGALNLYCCEWRELNAAVALHCANARGGRAR